MRLQWRQVTARRIARHFLAAESTDIPTAAAAMCGAHAQVMSAAEISIGVRQVGSHPREQLFPGRAWERALSRGQAGNFPVLLVDGVVGGVWHQKRSGKRIAVTVEPLVTLTKAQLAELDDQTQRVGEILEAVAELTIGKVTVGPHA